MFLVGLSWNLKLIEVILFWFRKFSGEIGQKYPFMFQPDTSLPRKRRSACLGEGLRLGEPEAPKFSVSTSPWRRLLRLGEPEVLFSLLSFVNSRNHQLD